MDKKSALTLFLALVALSSVAIVAMVSSISLSSDVSVASIGGFVEDNEIDQGITMGDPKGGDWC